MPVWCPHIADYTYDPLYRLITADYSTGDSYHYAYDSVGNRLTQNSSVHGLSSSISYNYDIANRLADVDGVPYVYDANGNLLNDGQNTYAYDSANRLTSVLGPSASSQYTYNGFGDRLSQNGIQYTLDLNAGLTQVLDDGTNNYTYGLGRISQQSGSTAEYFLGDALGSVRQLANNDGEVTLTNSYDPYGEVLSSAGSGSSAYAYIGEQQDASGLTYLRARYYNPADGRFLSRDTWGGNANRPMSMNRWMYVEGNPINRLDPSGRFSEELISASLHGQNLADTFGKMRHGVSRWALYNLLKNASSFNKFSLRVADFGYEGPDYPLAPDSEGEWAVYESGCELIFVNNNWGFQTLPEFLDTLNLKAELNANISNIWWRPSTMQYHWYKTNGRFYSDFYQGTDMPNLIMIGGGLFAGGKGSLGYIRDAYGNQYYTVGAGGVLGVGVAEHWEGYASINRAGNFPREWRVLSESELKNIILDGSWSFGASWVSSGIAITFNRAGMIAMFGDINALYGVFGNGSYAWEASTADFYHAWDWVYDIPAYGPPQ